MILSLPPSAFGLIHVLLSPATAAGLAIAQDIVLVIFVALGIPASKRLRTRAA